MRKQSVTIAVQTSYWEGGRENGFRGRARKRPLESLSYLLRARETVLRGGGAGRARGPPGGRGRRRGRFPITQNGRFLHLLSAGHRICGRVGGPER